MTTSHNVADHFSNLLNRIEPTERDLAVYHRHEKTVTQRLENVFKTNKLMRIGSYSRGTSIRSTSDVDLMLVLTRDEVRWGGEIKSSTTVLNSVRSQLNDRYFRTSVRRDKQAIVVEFGNNQFPVDIVPAAYHRHDERLKQPIYIIPDGEGGWTETSPMAHNKFINESNTASGGKLKRTAKLIKFWRSCREPMLPLNSFHVELFLAKERICVGALSYAVCFNNALASLANNHCRALNDPLGLSGEIDATKTDVMRERVQTAILSSAQRAYKAIAAENQGDLIEAIRLWQIVFNYQF